MAVVSLSTLKSYFETGDMPTQAQFVDLIDTLAALPEGLTDEQLAAVNAANSPDGSNPFATVADVPSVFPFSLRTSVPSTSQDSSAGYAVGYIVKNTTTGLVYVCTNAAVGAAVWELDINQIYGYRISANRNEIRAGNDMPISQCGALPAGYAWSVQSGVAILTGSGTPFNGNPDVNIKASSAGRQQLYDGQAILAGGSDTAVQLARRGVVAAGSLNPTVVESSGLVLSFGNAASTVGDGTLVVTGCAQIIKL